MDQPSFFFHRSSEAQCHLDLRSLRSGDSDAEYVWFSSGTSILSLELWLQYYHSTAEQDHQRRVQLQAC